MADSDSPSPIAVARRKFHCPACGAEATWNPARRALACAFCGTESAADLTEHAGGGGIVEHDLAAALQEAPAGAGGASEERTSVRCQSCEAVSDFPASQVGSRCEFCGSAALVPYAEGPQALRPESLLPLKVSEVQVRDSIRAWYGQRWFAPSGLGTRALTDTVRGVYLPYWTFDAHVEAHWEAESGYHYYVTETYRDSNGNTQERQVRHTRWEPSAGDVRQFFDDDLVAASRGVPLELLAQVEPFPTRELVPYHAGYLAGWTVERHQVDLRAAAVSSRERMEEALRRRVVQSIPGDTYRGLEITAAWSGETFKHILVPVWLLTYAYHGRSYQVVVNGFTGRIAGRHPISVWKVLLLVVGILLGVGLIFLMTHRR